MPSLPIPLRIERLMNLTLWSFWRRFRVMYRRPMNQSPDTTVATPVGDGANALRSLSPSEEQESDYRREFCSSSWAASIKRIYEIDPLECPKCRAQMRIIQDEHSIKGILKAQGIPDFQAPPPIPTFIDTVEAVDELPSYDSFEPPPDDF